MSYFEWAEDMVVDRGPIDADHQRLIAFVNRLHSATSQGEGRLVVGQILDELLAYTREHFEREERLMAALKFPRFDEHRAAHRRLLASAQALLHQAESSITTAARVSLLLRDWLSLHIRREDRELRALLMARGR